MYYIIITVHIVLCLFLITLVLIQQGKGADMGATFGGGGSNTFFGATGATAFITKLTTGIAVAFMVTSIGLIYFDPATSGGGIALPMAQGTDKVKALLDSKLPAQESAPQPVENSQEK